MTEKHTYIPGAHAIPGIWQGALLYDPRTRLLFSSCAAPYVCRTTPAHICVYGPKFTHTTVYSPLHLDERPFSHASLPIIWRLGLREACMRIRLGFARHTRDSSPPMARLSLWLGSSWGYRYSCSMCRVLTAVAGYITLHGRAMRAASS